MANRETEAACSCGHTRNHHMVSAEPEHGLIGTMTLIFGVSARPKRIVYRCRKCDEVFAESRDPALLAKVC